MFDCNLYFGSDAPASLIAETEPEDVPMTCRLSNFFCCSLTYYLLMLSIRTLSRHAEDSVPPYV